MILRLRYKEEKGKIVLCEKIFCIHLQIHESSKNGLNDNKGKLVEY